VQNESAHCHVAIIGAGPYGLSAAAYLRAAGVETRAFGEPMAFWQNQMPAGMCLRSNWGASHIADPRRELTLDEYCRQNGKSPVEADSARSLHVITAAGTSAALFQMWMNAISAASNSIRAGLRW
jgi:cation diffusion facilitator CzcD-associated flavoprotein CzcO